MTTKRTRSQTNQFDEGYVPAASIVVEGPTQLLHPDKPDMANFVNGVIPPIMNSEQIEAHDYLTRFAMGEEDEKDKKRPYLGRVVILTGAAGTGKTCLVHWLRGVHPHLFTVAATTGSAALHIGGVTVDKLFCMNRNTGTVNTFKLQKIMGDVAPCIIVDEGSMIGYKMAKAIAQVLDLYPQKRLIIVGDWAQARPVKDKWPFHHPLFKQSYHLALSKVERQSDPEFAKKLEELRWGEFDVKYFKRCRKKMPDNDAKCICAFATNEAALERNKEMYAWLKGNTKGADEWTLGCRMEKRGFGRDRKISWQPHKPSNEQEVRMFEASRMADRIKVRGNTRLLVTRNASDLSYVNGDTGVLVDCDAEKRLLRLVLDRTGEEVLIPETTTDIHDPTENVKFPTKRLVGFPVQYGWAVTIHRLQGMTVPRLWVDPESLYKLTDSNRHGLMYVACSRTRKVDQLELGSTDQVAWCDPAVKNLL